MTSEPVRYRRPGLVLDLYDAFIPESESYELYESIMKKCAWSRPLTTSRRSNATYGDEGLVYEIHWYGKTTKRSAICWEAMPELIPIRDRLELITEQKYNFCVIQYYPNGKIGINPHRDKEMKPGTTICGISLGARRTLRMNKYGINIDIGLPSGSLYLFHPPTNDRWSHSIASELLIPEGRISLTFRNY